ncbi:MAG: glycosyltransferase, partial [Acetobacteraceae bacterium]|nr:glycosyltransferase [Acetobacteraceae bacterium]
GLAPVRLVIVGDGPERAALEAQVASLGLVGQVTFTGHREDTPALYAGFDLFALSSDTEQMPLSVLEAMASGLPVAATDVGDVAAMLAAENAGFVVPLAEDALAGALAALIDDPELRRRLGTANRTKAAREFDQATMAQRWRALWDGTAPPA